MAKTRSKIMEMWQAMAMGSRCCILSPICMPVVMVYFFITAVLLFLCGCKLGAADLVLSWPCWFLVFASELSEALKSTLKNSGQRLHGSLHGLQMSGGFHAHLLPEVFVSLDTHLDFFLV